MVVRYLVVDIPPMQQLGIPSIAAELIKRKRGLFLVVGAMGLGKSTILASLIDHRNSTMGGHSVTIEDPFEFIHRHNQSIVNPREVDVDTRSWENALKNTMLQAPNVFHIDEIRDRATMEYAVPLAETGHLCVSTLHANKADNANQALFSLYHEVKITQEETMRNADSASNVRLKIKLASEGGAGGAGGVGGLLLEGTD